MFRSNSRGIGVLRGLTTGGKAPVVELINGGFDDVRC
jgi:hypothetical protein